VTRSPGQAALDDGAHRFEQLLERAGALRPGVESGQGEAQAAIARLERFHLPVP
jgi:hypothetical protein